MNRHQRRLKDKRHLNKVEEQMKWDGAKLAVDTLSVLPAYAIMEEFGFGKKRLYRYMKRFTDTYRAVIEKKVTLETLASCIEDKGIKIDLKSSEWTDCKRRYIRRSGK